APGVPRLRRSEARAVRRDRAQPLPRPDDLRAAGAPARHRARTGDHRVGRSSARGARRGGGSTLMRVLAVLLAAVAATGSSDAPPSFATACGSAPAIAARPLWLTTADGVRLYAIEAGDGAVGVVLAHQGRSDLCEELPYAKTLVDAGL